MKSLLIYSSVHHQNTARIAQVMAEALNADLLDVREAGAIDLSQYDVIGFGSGIYHGEHAETLFRFVETVDIQGKTVFVFSTSGSGNKKYNQPLIEHLMVYGAVVINSFCCKGYDTFGFFRWIGGIAKGRPNETDLDRAAEFAACLTTTDIQPVDESKLFAAL